MTVLVVLTGSEIAVPEGYDVRLGPLAFVTPADSVGEQVGDPLEVVGAHVAAGQRRARAFRLKLPVRGDHREADPTLAGRKLRRQVRQLLNNSRWRSQGFYFTWSADAALDCWLLAGTADLSESDPGITFGEFDLELGELFVRGQPGTHRPGRRVIIADRRGGLVPRDTRRLLFSTDFSSQALPTEPAMIPGDVVDVVATGNQPIASSTAGLLRGSRRLWRSCSAIDGQAITYRPDDSLLNQRTRYLDVDAAGATRVWDLTAATEFPPNPANYTTAGDGNPDPVYGWEQVLGDVTDPSTRLAMDNGACRLIWLGAAANQGLAIEYWDAATSKFKRIGRVLHALNVREQRVVEVTSERAILEWRAGQYALRAILQRGWWGPRLESYDDTGGTTRLEFAPDAGGTVTLTPQTPSWVRQVTSAGAGSVPLLWASASNDETADTTPTVITGTAATWRRSRVLVAQLGCPPGPAAAALASLSLVDAQCVPILVERR